MSAEDQLAQQLAEIISRSLAEPTVLDNLQAAGATEVEAKASVADEESFYRAQLHSQHIADMQSARAQREKYARWVFGLVAGWIVALFCILLAQGADSNWRPFSDKVLIALIGSMTVNLIGTLVIVLKYIFKADNVAS